MGFIQNQRLTKKIDQISNLEFSVSQVDNLYFYFGSYSPFSSNDREVGLRVRIITICDVWVNHDSSNLDINLNTAVRIKK
jgi:hypothetical protein